MPPRTVKKILHDEPRLVEAYAPKAVARESGFLSDSPSQGASDKSREVEARLRKDLKARFEETGDVHYFKRLSGATLSMLAEEIASSGGNANAKVVEVCGAIHKISEKMQDPELQRLIEDPATRKLLVEKPSDMVRVSVNFDWGANYIFDLCRVQRVAAWIFSDVEKGFDALKGLDAKYGEAVLCALSCPEMMNLYIDKPNEALKIFEKVKSAFGNDAILVYEQLKWGYVPDSKLESLGRLLIKDTGRTLQALCELRDALSGVFKASDLGSETNYTFYTVVGNRELMKAAFQKPVATGKMIADMLLGFGGARSSVTYALQNEHMAAFFLKDRKGFEESIRSLYSNVEKEFADTFLKESLNGKEIGKWFASDPANAIARLQELAKTLGKEAGEGALEILSKDAIAKFFISKPKEFLSALSNLEASFHDKYGAQCAIELLGSEHVLPLFIGEGRTALVDDIISIAMGSDRDRQYGLFSSFNKHEGFFFANHSKEALQIISALDVWSYVLISKLSMTLGQDVPTIAGKVEEIIGRGNGRAAGKIFDNEDIVDEFLSNPSRTAAAVIRANEAFGERAYDMFELVSGEASGIFLSYCKGEVKLEEMMFSITVLNASEIGAGLDRMHNDSLSERAQYIKEKLSEQEVTALLVSDPALFHTWTNNLLFNRFQEILQEKGSSVSGYLEEKGIAGGSHERNLIFRAMGYARFYGTKNAVFSKSDVEAALPVLFEPLGKKEFDQTYIYLLSNNIKGVVDSGNGKELLALLKGYGARFGKGEYGQTAADFMLGYAEDYMDNKKIDSKIYRSEFDGNRFKDSEGVINILQVFVRADTGGKDIGTLATLKEAEAAISREAKKPLSKSEQQKLSLVGKGTTMVGAGGMDFLVESTDEGYKVTRKDAWGYTKDWFLKYGGKVQDGQGKVLDKNEINAENSQLTYEFTKGGQKFRMTLFMGESEAGNRDFTRKSLSEHKNIWLALRAHSYSLKNNAPASIFDNKEGNVLYIPGTCGSANSIPDYISSNPQTNLSTVSNNSTGRWKVTNTLFDIFIDEAASGKVMDYEKLLDLNEKRIADAGGDRETLAVSTLGEQTLKHVYGVAKGAAKTEFY